MSTGTQQRGFTLVELLVAVALIATVLSITYGSYVVTTRSAQAGKSRIALFREGRQTLEQMARHIRCSYASAASDPKDDVQDKSNQSEVSRETEISYFDGDADAPNGEILNFVSTSRLTEDKEAEYGLFQIVYRFNRRTTELAVSSERFVATSEGTEKRIWRVIADQMRSVDLAFFDGEKWSQRWDFTDKKVLPRAVRIEIGGENESLQRYDYSTVAYVSCRDYQSVERMQTLVSADK